MDLWSRARELRRQATDAERVLWQHLRARRMCGCKFRRQVVIPPYIADFASLEARLIIEVDGGQHLEKEAYDEARTACFEGMGYRILRFWNHEVLCDLPSVLERIDAALDERPFP